MPNQYEQVGSGVSHLGQVAQQIALGLAQQKQQQQQAQQMMQLKLREQAMQEAIAQQRGQLMGQQGKQAESMTGFNNARAGQVVQQDKSRQMLKDALWQRGMVDAGTNQGVDMGPRADIANSRMMEAMGGLNANAFDPEKVAQMLQMSNPRMQQLMATGTKATANVGPGASLVDTIGGLSMYDSPRTMGPNQVLRPNVEGSQGLPQQFAPNDPNRILSVLQRSLGSLANLEQNARDPFGKLVNPEDPRNAQVAQAISQITDMLTSGLKSGAQGGGPRIGLTNAPAPLQSAPTQLVAPKDKAALANQLSQQNPTWTREQVLNAVKQQLGE